MSDNKQKLTGNDLYNQSSTATNTSKTVTDTNLTFTYNGSFDEVERIEQEIKYLELSLKIKQLELEIAKLRQKHPLVAPMPVPTYPSWPDGGTPGSPWYDPYKIWCIDPNSVSTINFLYTI